MPREYGMTSLILALKEAKIKAEAVPVYMNQVQTATKYLKDKDEITTSMVNAGQINETTTLCLPTEESMECRRLGL